MLSSRPFLASTSTQPARSSRRGAPSPSRCASCCRRVWTGRHRARRRRVQPPRRGRAGLRPRRAFLFLLTSRSPSPRRRHRRRPGGSSRSPPQRDSDARGGGPSGLSPLVRHGNAIIIKQASHDACLLPRIHRAEAHKPRVQTLKLLHGEASKASSSGVSGRGRCSQRNRISAARGSDTARSRKPRSISASLGGSRLRRAARDRHSSRERGSARAAVPPSPRTTPPISSAISPVITCQASGRSPLDGAGAPRSSPVNGATLRAPEESNSPLDRGAWVWCVRAVGPSTHSPFEVVSKRRTVLPDPSQGRPDRARDADTRSLRG
jgi:hypothetical protein